MASTPLRGDRIEENHAAASLAVVLPFREQGRQRTGTVVDHLDAYAPGTSVDMQLNLRASVNNGVRHQLADEKHSVVEHHLKASPGHGVPHGPTRGGR